MAVRTNHLIFLFSGTKGLPACLPSPPAGFLGSGHRLSIGEIVNLQWLMGDEYISHNNWASEI